MMDYSPFVEKSMALASDIPGLSNLRRDLPGAVQAGSLSVAQAEAADIEKRGGKALAANAQAIGLDPGMVEQVYKIDPARALDMIIQGTERYNSDEAEKYVGTQIEGVTMPKEGYMNDDGLTPIANPEEINKRLSADRRKHIEGGIQTAKNPYVKRAYEGRLTKMKEEEGTWRQQLAEKNSVFRQAALSRMQMEAARKEAGINTPLIVEAAKPEALNKRMDEIEAMIGQAEKDAATAGDPGAVGIYAMGSAEGLIQQDAGVMGRIAQAILAASDQNTRNELAKVNTDTHSLREAYKKLQGEKKGKAAIAVNQMLTSAMMMGVFERIHELTGAAMSEGERGQYLNAFGVNSREGAPAVLRWYNSSIDERNMVRKAQIKEYLAKLDQNFALYPDDPSYLDERQRALAALNTDLPKIDPAFIETIDKRTVSLPDQTPIVVETPQALDRRMGLMGGSGAPAPVVTPPAASSPSSAPAGVSSSSAMPPLNAAESKLLQELKARRVRKKAGG